MTRPDSESEGKCSWRPAARRSRNDCFGLAEETWSGAVVLIDRFVEEAFRDVRSEDEDDELDASELEDLTAEGGCRYCDAMPSPLQRVRRTRI